VVINDESAERIIDGDTFFPAREGVEPGEVQVNKGTCVRNSEQVIRNELDSGTETSPSRGPEAAWDTKDVPSAFMRRHFYVSPETGREPIKYRFKRKIFAPRRAYPKTKNPCVILKLHIGNLPQLGFESLRKSPASQLRGWRTAALTENGTFSDAIFIFGTSSHPV